jgi:hypothetical protein
MSVETSSTSQFGDGDSDEGGRHRFTFRSADSAADPVDRDDDNLDDDAVSADADDDDLDDDNVVRGTVVDEDADDEADTDPVVFDRDAVVTDSDAVVSDPDAVVSDPDPVATGWDTADDPAEAQPTFTPVDDGTVDSVPDPTAPTLSETDDVPVVPAQETAPVTDVPVADTTATPVSPAPVIDADEPLLGDPVGLRASWQQAQAGFVDDPRAAVADAAELVEHTAQTLIGSLQQRQRQLRDQWDNNGSATPGGAGEPSDTEQLRHLMQDYRSLFNQLCQP